MSNTDFDSQHMYMGTLFLAEHVHGDSDYWHARTDSRHAHKAALSTSDFHSQCAHVGTLFLVMCAWGP